MESTPDDLASKLPPVFTEYFNYFNNTLKFGERPEYDELANRFEVCLKEQLISHDDKFDWILQKQLLIDKRESREVELKKQDQLRKAKNG